VRDRLKVFCFFDGSVKRLEKPLVVILDNASIHIAPKNRLIRIYYPPQECVYTLYRPQLNRIKMLWRRMKYQGLPFDSFTPIEFEQEIDSIGSGSEYTLTGT
jgi:hypothetical protein